MGGSRDSGFRLGLDAWADNGISSGASRMIRGKSRDPLPFSRSGLIMGDFVGVRVYCKGRCHGMLCIHEAAGGQSYVILYSSS